jgi:hypothetical protein
MVIFENIEDKYGNIAVKWPGSKHGNIAVFVLGRPSKSGKCP